LLTLINGKVTAVILLSLIVKTVENPVWIQSGKKIQPVRFFMLGICWEEIALPEGGGAILNIV
jgi:hypothetical protein